LKIKI
jgi:hypothetical protein